MCYAVGDDHNDDNDDNDNCYERLYTTTGPILCLDCRFVSNVLTLQMQADISLLLLKWIKSNYPN